MKNYFVKRYEPQDFDVWNAFVGEAKNATFLFQRHFMEYHADRFSDYSLMVFDEELLVALLPANVVDNTIFSHQGLTYGGIVFASKMRLEKALSVFKSILEFLHLNGISTLQIKSIPSFYCDYFSNEIEYALFVAEAKLVRRDCLSVIDLSKSYQYSKDRKEGVKRGIKNGLEVIEEDDFTGFWNEILIPNLNEKHDVAPVHSLQEIQLLKSHFPKDIRQFNLYHNGKIIAGTTIFESKNAAHSQYISGNSDKNILGSLDFLHDFLLKTVFKEKHFFDFGISNENQGKNLNQGLLYWKESFGSKTVTQDFYELETANFVLLEKVFL